VERAGTVAGQQDALGPDPDVALVTQTQADSTSRLRGSSQLRVLAGGVEVGQRLEPDQAVIECPHPAAFTD
jgi:hypothetical protein